MLRFLFILFLVALPLSVGAIEAPHAQIQIGQNQILRGHFTHEYMVAGVADPMRTIGHFIAAPNYGLIWGIEQPFPTSTIIGPNTVVQDIGGMAMKLPAKNIRHLYDMVSGALAGNWQALEKDFTITREDSSNNWQMTLTPRRNQTSGLSYASITVSGAQFVEHIVMRKNNGGYDSIDFSEVKVSAAPPAATELAAFSKIK